MAAKIATWQDLGKRDPPNKRGRRHKKDAEKADEDMEAKTEEPKAPKGKGKGKGKRAGRADQKT